MDSTVLMGFLFVVVLLFGFLFVYGFASQSPGIQLCNPGLIIEYCKMERIFCTWIQTDLAHWQRPDFPGRLSGFGQWKYVVAQVTKMYKTVISSAIIFNYVILQNGIF